MKRFMQWMLLVGFWTGTSCTTPQKTLVTTKGPATTAVFQPSNYTALGPHQSIQDFGGQQIWIEGQMTNMIDQHMMKTTIDGTPPHVYVNYHKGKQVVAYFENRLEPPTQMGKIYRFYGVVNSISGAGKGGETHTEYYLDVIQVE